MNAAAARAIAQGTDPRPGRMCPTSYLYSPRVFDRAPEIVADTLYVVGGLYGNVEALERVLELAGDEAAGARVVFNGDFHWFDVEARDFARVQQEAMRHGSLRGNVETELAQDDSLAGCGCAYPADVSDAEVSRSNAILARLRSTACADTDARAALSALPMHLVARVGDARVGIVHGDARSLAGWGFAADKLDAPAHRRWIDDAFAQACVDIFACSHTCLPAMRRFAAPRGSRVVANNGAAGMPNFTGTRHGLVTRISLRPGAAGTRVYGVDLGHVHVDAVRVDYDHARWMERFLASWPAGSDAHVSYHRRMLEGPRHRVAQAAPVA